MTVAMPMTCANGRRCGEAPGKSVRIHQSEPDPRKHTPGRPPDEKRQQAIMKVTNSGSRISRLSAQCPARMTGLQPLRRHHQDPDHLTIVAGVFFQTTGEKVVGQFVSYQATATEVAQGLPGERSKCRIADQPRSDGETEPMLAFGDDLGWKKPGQRSLKKCRRRRPLTLSRGASRSDKSTSASLRSGKPTTTPATCAAPLTFGKSLSARVNRQS